MENQKTFLVQWKWKHNITKFGDVEFPEKNIYFCFVDSAKAFGCVDHYKLWKILKEMGIPDHLSVSWETCMPVKKPQLEPCMEQVTGSKLGKEYVQAAYCRLFI